MGRQIEFYMLPEDQNAFLQFAQERDPVVLVAELDRQGPTVRPVEDMASVRNPMFCLWNRALLPFLKRKPIGEGDHRTYLIDIFRLPILEFSPTHVGEWEGKPALILGRLYGRFDPYFNKPPEFEKWFDRLVRWIRKNFKRSPVGFGGYVGPAAYRLYIEGGYLLPNYRPPRTDAWLARIAKQHPADEQQR